MIKLNNSKRITKKQLGGFLSNLVTQNAPTIVPKINSVLDSLFNRETESRNFVPSKQPKINPKDMKDIIEKRRALYGNGNAEYDKFEGITPDLKAYQETLNPEEKRLFSKYKDFYHVNEGLDANGNIMNINVKNPQSKDAYDPDHDYFKNEGSCKGLGCYELILDDNRDIIPKDKMRMIRRKSALNLDVIPENYDGIVDEFVNTGIARKLKDRNEPFDIKKHSKMINEAIARGDKVFWQKIYQPDKKGFIAGHSGYFTQPYKQEDGSQKGLITFASEQDGLNANHYYDFKQDKRSLDAMGIAVIPKKTKQLGGSIDNTSVKRPFSIIDIERNKKDFYQRQLEQNKTFLNPQKDVNPNAKQVFIDEQQKREANNRINKRQDLVNNVALAASPLPVVGEIFGAASGIANGVVDLAQGEYGNVALNASPYGISKIPFNKLGSKYLPNAYKVNPFANKGENGYMDLMRIQEKNGVPLAQLAREGRLFPTWLNNEETAIKLGEKEKHFGEWFTNDKSDIDWYMNDRQFKNPEIINLKVPNNVVNKYSVNNISTAKKLSSAHDREFIIPKAEQDNFKPDWLRGYTKQLGGVLKSDDRSNFKRFFDEKTKPIRDLSRMYSETAEKGYETFDKNYPTVSDKASAITAVTSLFPHPAVKYPSMGANIMLDLLNLENDDNKAELAAELAALYLNQIPKLAGKKINLASRLLTGVTSLNSDILPKDAKIKKFPKK